MFEIWIRSPDCLYAIAWFQKSTTETQVNNTPFRFLLVLFIIDLLRTYMANSLYVYVIYTLILIQATLVFEEIICFFSAFIIDDAIDLFYVCASKCTFLLWWSLSYWHVLCCLLLVQLMREPSSHRPFWEPSFSRRLNCHFYVTVQYTVWKANHN